MDTIMAPVVDAPGSKPPRKLTEPEVMAEKLARAETSNFNRVTLRSEEAPPYQSGFSDEQAKDYYKTMWLPYQALMATALEPRFDAIDKAVATKFEDWKSLLQKLDQRATVKKRFEHAHDSNPDHVERVPVKDLIYENEVKDLLLPLVQPLIAAIAGNGASLLDSALPPILLHFLLELDHQHTANWKLRRDRLLEWQLFYYRTQDLHAEIVQQRKANPKDPILNEWDERYRKNIKNYEAQVAVLKVLGPSEKAELEALQKLTAPPWQPDLVKGLEKQARTRDVEFSETRQKSIAAFIGTRGCSDIYRLRRDEADKDNKDTYRSRLHGVLDKLLAAELAIHSIIYRLMNCSESDQSSIRRAAKLSFPRQQQAWEEICKLQGARRQWKRMVEAEDRREKKRNKQKIAGAKISPPVPRIARSDKRLEPPPGRMPASLRQPDIALSEEELAARREKRVQGFIDRYAISPEARPKLGEDVAIPKRMKRELLAMAHDKVSNKAMLKKAIAILGEELIGREGEARDELNVLLKTLNEALKELVLPPAISGPAIPPKPQDEFRPSNQ